MQDYEDDEIEGVEPQPRKPVRVMFNDFLKIVADAEAFEGALCQDPLLGPNYMFGNNRLQKIRKELCRTPCPVRERCLKHALDNQIPFGVWGGFTERERKTMFDR